MATPAPMISDNRHRDRHHVGEKNALMEHVVNAFGPASAVGTGNERDGPNRQPEHHHHQQEDELTGKPERRKRLFGVDETAAHRGVDGKRHHAEHVQADNRHGKIEEAPKDGAIDVVEWT